MGTVFKRGKRWGINYIDPQGNQVRKLVSPYKETAQKVLSKIETEIAEGRYLNIKKCEKILFENFAQKYIETHIQLENKTVKKQSNKVQNMAICFKGKYLNQVSNLMIREYMNMRLTKARPSTVNRDLTILKSMFNRAIEWGYLLENPAKGIKKLAENNERCRWLDEEEQKRLLSCCSGLTRIIVLVALKSGLRWGEIASLKWQQAPNSNYVDFEENIIFIHESQSKSQKSRYVPLSQTVKKELLALPCKSEYIFMNSDTDQPLKTIKTSFHTALRRAGIKDFRFHDLRHTFASSLVRRNVDLYVVQKLLGHASPKMTQRYAHLRSDQLHSAIEKIDFDMDDTNEVNLANSTNLAQSRFSEQRSKMDVCLTS